jgi:hypothetical protein
MRSAYSTPKAAPSPLLSRDYQGSPFIFREDGYFNMTKAAQHFGKRVQNFLDVQETQHYIIALAESMGVGSFANKSEEVLVAGIPVTKAPLVQGVSGKGSLPGVGRWAHPKLAVFFARWLDVRFAVWCDAVIDDILHKKAELVITKPQESAVMALPESYSATMFAFAESVMARARLLQEHEAEASGAATSCACFPRHTSSQSLQKTSPRAYTQLL